MNLMWKLLGRFTERTAARQDVEQIIDKLADYGAQVTERMAGAADTQRNREAAAHIIGIERWSQRRLRTALGEAATNDEYDGYRPAADLDMPALTEQFEETRRQTIALAHQAADLPDSVTVRHNDLGELTVKGWLVYIENHATRESQMFRMPSL